MVSLYGKFTRPVKNFEDFNACQNYATIYTGVSLQDLRRTFLHVIVLHQVSLAGINAQGSKKNSKITVLEIGNLNLL